MTQLMDEVSDPNRASVTARRLARKAQLMTDEKQTTETDPNSLWKKLATASDAVAYLQKDGRNEAQRYTYLSEAAVKQAVTHALVANRLSYAGVVTEIIGRWEMQTRGGSIMRGYDVKAAITIADVDTGTTVMLTGLGSGTDTGDKGLMKAQTAAVKCALMHGLGIASGDDPERDGPADEAASSPAPKKPQRAEKVQDAQKAPKPEKSRDNQPRRAADWVVPFGRSKGKTLAEVGPAEADSLCKWMMDKLSSNPNSQYASQQRESIATVKRFLVENFEQGDDHAAEQQSEEDYPF